MKKILAFILAAIMLISAVATTAMAETATDTFISEDSHLKIENKYIVMVDGPATVMEMIGQFTSMINVLSANGERKDSDDNVATDDKITIGETYSVLLYGDVDRNGKINLGDIAGVLKSIAKWGNDINTDAADVDKNEKMNLADVSKMLKYIAKWEDISLGNVRMVFENTPVKGENDDAALDLFFTSVMNKLGVTENAHTGEYAYKMMLGKNEAESCQALMVSTENKEGLTAELSDFEYEFGGATLESELEWVMYYNTTVFTQVNPWYNGRNEDSAKHDDFPEVVIDMADSFELKADRMQHMVITVTSTKDSPAGMYKSTLSIKDAEGKVLKSANVYAYVYDFTVPDAPYSASLFATARYNTAANPGVNTYPEYFEYMLDMNLSSYVLPYEITDERADDIMSDPRVTAFVIAGGGIGGYGRPGMYGGLMDETEEQTVANYNKVASNPEWFKKGMFYYTDEPYGEGLFQVRDSYNYLTELLGTTNIRNMTPFGQSYPNAEYQSQAIDSVEFIKDYINVWVPISMAYHRMAEGGNWTPRYVVSKRGEYYERVEAFRERGDDIWWYVCCAPEVPYANYFTCYEGVINRLLSWQQYFNNVNGVLYYSTGEGWGGISKYQFDIGNGDGTLLFPGEYWGRTGPQASWRLLQVRDGFDDFDYLRMAEELVGREAVMKVVSKVSGGMLDYTEDYKVLEACRKEIANMIVEAQAK